MNSDLMLQQFADGSPVMEIIIFLSYILVCAALFKSRFSRLVTLFSLGAAVIVIIGVNTVIMLSDTDKLNLMLTLFPLTAYLPFSLLLYFLADSGIFETAAVCSFGVLDVFILKSLDKMIIGFAAPLRQAEGISVSFAMANVITSIAAVCLVFVAFRFIGEAFRFCVFENRQNQLLLLVPVISLFLMMLWFLNSTTTKITLIFSVLIALSVFFIIGKLLNSGAELIRVKRSEVELSEYIDIQRRGYDRAVQKIEATREYRHNMRHHFAVIEGLAKQGDCDKIIEYTSNLNGSFSKLESVDYCKNPELNAVLSEYIKRAENMGCKIKQSFVLSEKLPFEENDVCLVLANAIENAINACAKFPEEKRYINIFAVYEDLHRLLISVENPCSDTIKFDENGLPVTDKLSEEHGIGLRSVKHIAEKYNGFLRCKQENGEFIFKTALFYDDNASEHRSGIKKAPSTAKRVASSLLGLGIGAVVMLNVLPSAAEAASSLLSINIKTIRNIDLVWGSNSISTQEPEFTGSGSDELNSAVKSCTDEAKEKFLWYFSRRYNGYVAEDMRYTVIRDDENYFTAEFNVTINAGGSMDYGRWIVYDKSLGKVLELSDLFKEGSNYIEILSAEILGQMIDKNEHYNGSFFVEGEDAFTKISEDANFYIDTFDRLVIVFDEYEVAPGSMGSPKFFISQKVFQEIAK